MSCGNCFGCDNCFRFCPDNAVLQITGAHGYEIDYDYCKGCGLCAAECPSGAIVMEPERYSAIEPTAAPVSHAWVRSLR
ncbi:MAG: 4Fe-4S dicluster domain-containing protein [Pseudonocardiales bacterium]